MDRIIVKFLSGGRAGHTEVYPVTRFSSLYLGRDPKCDVRVDAERDAMVSRSHAVIEWVDHEEEGWRQYTLTDLLSSNGTYLNGQRVHGTVDLSSGDHIRLGVQGPEFLLEVEHPEPNMQAVVTQSLRADQFLRTPPPRTRSAADAVDASATVRGAHLASRLEQNIEQPAASSTAEPGQKREG